jgi:hypothetical protein
MQRLEMLAGHVDFDACQFDVFKSVVTANDRSYTQRIVDLCQLWVPLLGWITDPTSWAR